MIPVPPKLELNEENKSQVIEIDSSSIDKHSYKGVGKQINLELHIDGKMRNEASTKFLPLSYYWMCDFYQYLESLVPATTRYEVYQPVGNYYGCLQSINPYQF